jgi:acyl carrier protein
MNTQIFDIVSSALTELNEELQYDTLENITADTCLMSGDDAIDSLSLVRLIVVVETEVANTFGKKVALAQDISLGEGETPFSTVGSLVSFVDGKLKAAA